MAKGEQAKYLVKVLTAVEKSSSKTGKKYWPVQLQAWNEDGTGEPVELDCSIPPWLGWLFPVMAKSAGTDGGLVITVEEGDAKTGENGGVFMNVIGIDGVEKPADWQDEPHTPKAAGEAGGKAPSPSQTRIAVIAAVNKVGELNLIKDEAGWNAWYWKLDSLVFNGKKVNVGDFGKPRT